MSKERLWLLVEGTPYLAACLDWKRRYREASDAAFRFAHSLGAAGYFHDLAYQLNAITPVTPIPDGWVKAKLAQKYQPRLVPAKKQAGEMARAGIAALPRTPRWPELARLIGHPCQVRYRVPSNDEGEEDRRWGFSECGAGFANLVQLTWTADQLALVVGDTAPTIARLQDEFPDVIIEEGPWTPPAGLRQITEAQWDLIMAQAKVDQELKELVHVG